MDKLGHFEKLSIFFLLLFLQESVEGCEVVKAGQPQQAWHNQHCRDLTQRDLHCSSSPRNPESLLSQVQDLRDEVGLDLATWHQAVHCGVQGLAVAAEAQQVGPLPLPGEVLTATQGVGLSHNTVMCLLSVSCRTPNIVFKGRELTFVHRNYTTPVLCCVMPVIISTFLCFSI